MQFLVDVSECEAQQIIHCYDRATRYAHKYPDTAKLHVAFSGGLLEQLSNREVVDRYKHHMDIPAMLNSYREAGNIELLSTGYAHPIFPLIPEADWADQLTSARQQMEDLFGRAPKGFYPPAMMFSMAMIPALVKAGYEYVVLDSWMLKNAEGQGVSPFETYTLTHEGKSITAVPRDVEMSNAQQNGLDAAWFADETRQRAAGDGARLMTTWSDGENSPWFRNMDESHGFFGQFFAPYIEHVEGGEYPITPVAISEFIVANPAQSNVTLETPIWNPSEGQAQALSKIAELSQRYHSLSTGRPAAKLKAALPQAQSLLRESETSCFLFWHDEWLGKIDACVKQANDILDEASKPAAKKSATPKTAASSSTATSKTDTAKTTTTAKKPAAKTTASKPTSASSKSSKTPTKSSASKTTTKAGTTTKKTSTRKTASTASKPSSATTAKTEGARKTSSASTTSADSTEKTTPANSAKKTPPKK
jgi:hypothetical protein